MNSGAGDGGQLRDEIKTVIPFMERSRKECPLANTKEGTVTVMDSRVTASWLCGRGEWLV